MTTTPVRRRYAATAGITLDPGPRPYDIAGPVLALESSLVVAGDVAYWRGWKCDVLEVIGHHVKIRLAKPLDGRRRFTVSRYDLWRMK